MDPNTSARTAEHFDREIRQIDWNGEPFVVIEPPHRSIKIVRTKLVSPEQRRRFNRIGWPRDMILIREHNLKFRGDDMTMKITTNAEEAEDETPERVLTPIRDTGTYRDATVVFRGRPVRSFVSMRMSAPVEHADVPAAASPFPPDILAKIAATLGSGILVRKTALVEALSQDERLLLNLLIAHKDGRDGACMSLREIGRILGVSDEAVRRRRDALIKRHPTVGPIIASFRARNAKGAPVVTPLRPARDSEEDDAEE